jgi:hypothetical protein
MRPIQMLLLLGSVPLILWYIGCLYTLLSANGIQIGSFISSHFGVFSNPILLVLSLSIFLIGSKRFTEGVDSAFVVQSYVNNAQDVRSTIRGRIVDALTKAQEDNTYDSVTIFAHSFGCIIAIEVISHTSIELPPIRLVTAGSPLQLLASHDPFFANLIRAIYARRELIAWNDYCAPRDPFSTEASLPLDGKASQHILDIGITPFDALSGISHEFYFKDPRIAKAVFNIQ